MATLLGLLSAIGPFAIDMYLPALPAIGEALRAEIGAVQWSLTAFFVSLGAGQLFFGPLSDRFGRKPPLYVGLVLFACASVGCALATDIHTLIAWRFVQGLGAAAGMAIPRAVVRDLHTGTDAARLMALLMLVFSVSPILAPLVGSAIIAWTGWRGVFWVVTIAAAAGIAMMAALLPETRPADQRAVGSHESGNDSGNDSGNLSGNVSSGNSSNGIAGALASYCVLLRDRHYLGLVLIGGFAMAGFFTYLANSSFVLIGHWGLSPQAYSVAFGVNAASFFIAAQFTGALGDRFGLVPLLKAGVLASSTVMVAMLAYFALGGDKLWVLIVLYFVASGCMGMVIPSASVLALDTHGAIAGAASALMGSLQMLTGAVAMGVVGFFTDGRPLPMVAGMAGGALSALVLTRLTLGGWGRVRGQEGAPGRA